MRIPELLRPSYMLVHPTRVEALGRSLIEASAAARPVVATRVGGIPEVIEHGKTGLLCDPDDVEGFSSAMAALLHNTSLAARMGAEGRKRAVSLFSLESMIQSYLALYEECLSQPGVPRD